MSRDKEDEIEEKLDDEAEEFMRKRNAVVVVISCVVFFFIEYAVMNSYFNMSIEFLMVITLLFGTGIFIASMFFAQHDSGWVALTFGVLVALLIFSAGMWLCPIGSESVKAYNDEVRFGEIDELGVVVEFNISYITIHFDEVSNYTVNYSAGTDYLYRNETDGSEPMAIVPYEGDMIKITVKKDDMYGEYCFHFWSGIF